MGSGEFLAIPNLESLETETTQIDHGLTLHRKRRGKEVIRESFLASCCTVTATEYGWTALSKIKRSEDAEFTHVGSYIWRKHCYRSGYLQSSGRKSYSSVEP